MTRYVGGHEPAPRRRRYLWAGLATLAALVVGSSAAYACTVPSPSRASAIWNVSRAHSTTPPGTEPSTTEPSTAVPSTAADSPATGTAPAVAPTTTPSQPATAPGAAGPSAPDGGGAASPAVSTPAAAAPAGARVIRAYITAYSWFDNTPAGSAQISNPVLHHTAGGSGTYEDPITVAVGHSITGGRDVLDWPVGTRFYLPNLRRYFIVEDTCGDGGTPQNGPCHTGYPSSASTWLDVWAGGQGGSSNGADQCMNAVTRVSTVVVDAAPGYPVVAGDVYGPGGCTQQFGDALP